MRRAISRAKTIVSALPLTLIASPAVAQSSFAERTSMSWDGALTGMFLGLLFFSVAYNAAFFSILRERFLVWQSLRTLVFFALAIGLSPLAMGDILTPESNARQVYIIILFDLSIAVSGPFLRAYLEPGTVSPRVHRALGWSVPAIMLTTPALLIAACPPAYTFARNAVLIGMMILVCTALCQAIARGSRTARFQAAAWSVVLLVYGVSLFHDIVLGRPFEMLLFALFGALALEVVLTAIGIGDRFVRLRREHDEARATANALQIIADTDPLTGLANRRAIEHAFHARRPAAIALVDLDRFKTINDRFGHDVGDRVIFACGAALSSGSALAGRIGGEEFVLLLYGAPEDTAADAEQLRKRVTAQVEELVGETGGPVTASMGIALVTPAAAFGGAMKIADINLYAAKSGGRDRSVFSAGALAA